MEKIYLGDAVYAEYDGHYIVLTTGNGVIENNRIYLDAEVMTGLQKYAQQIWEHNAKP